jgi:hypothetical protein
MAAARFTKWGIEVEFEDSEVRQLISYATTGSAYGTLASALSAMFSASMSVIACIASAVVGTGANHLSNCNSRQSGITITILWYGRAWCKPR